MRTIFRLLPLACAYFASGICQGAPVTIARLDANGNDYTLVVNPQKVDPPDPYIGACERFEVHGTYGLLRGASKQGDGLSRKGHKEALQFLQQAFIAGKVVDLSAASGGFVPVDPANPCVVKSRALQLVKDDAGERVLSYHDATP